MAVLFCGFCFFPEAPDVFRALKHPEHLRGVWSSIESPRSLWVQSFLFRLKWGRSLLEVSTTAPATTARQAPCGRVVLLCPAVD